MPVALADLAELAGMPEEALCDVARSHGCTLRQTAGRLRGRWEEIERALAPNLRARVQAAAAVRGFNLQGGVVSLASVPEIAAQWHPTRNGAVRPEGVALGSCRVFWWTCPAGPDHEWPEQVGNRLRGVHACPFCANRRVSVTNSIATLRPDLAAQWHPTRNRPLTPASVTPRSDKTVWWRCTRDDAHEWQQKIVGHARAPAGWCSLCGPPPPAVQRVSGPRERQVTSDLAEESLATKLPAT